MDKDNSPIYRVPLYNNWDYLEQSKTIDCKRERFGCGYDPSEPKTPDIIISKDNYDSIRRHAINDHECSYYKEQGINPIGFRECPNNQHPIIKIPSNCPPPPPGPLKRTFASERIPSESFGEELIRRSKANLIRIEQEKEEKQRKFMLKVANRYKELMEFLTSKYYEQVVSCLKYNAEHGKNEAYMNFTYEDFKANMPTLGKPRQIQSKWLNEMKNPDSSYLNGRRPLQDISFDCWGNGAFTVHFTW